MTPMEQDKFEQKTETVCNLNYLIETMGGKKQLIRRIMDASLTQIPIELSCIDKAIEVLDYRTIQSYAHTMKSSLSIMGITILIPVLSEMENLGKAETGMDKIKELNENLNSVCMRALEEIEQEKHNYV
jgi:HPt (histidine-containing phosphotransfer) domain-containing protein